MRRNILGRKKKLTAKKKKIAFVSKSPSTPKKDTPVERPLRRSLPEITAKAQTLEETREILEECWSESIVLPFLHSKDVISASESSNDEVRKEYVSEYIENRVDTMSKNGFRAVFTGKEVIDAVKEKQDRLFMETILDVTETMLMSALGKMKEKEEKRPIDFDEFVFLSLARNDFDIAKEAFTGAMEGNALTNVHFIDETLTEKLEKVLEENQDKSGLDGVSQLFFDIFKSKNTVRENINIPIPEHLVGVEIS